MAVGFTEGLSFDEGRPNWDGSGPRPLKWSAWYPAIESAVERPLFESSWFQIGPVASDADILSAGKQYPLVLLSHGTGGVTAGLGWLGHRLAQNGFVAVAVNHHGNSGAEPYRAEGFICLWERANDLSALLDDAHLQQKLNGSFKGRAYVAGFSAGAYAAMLLMGARVAYSQFEADNPVKSPVRGPIEFPDLADQIPLLHDRSVVFRASWERRGANFGDNRFAAALVLAPGRSVLGFARHSLTQIDKPVRIVVGDGDRVAPASECSGWLHSRVQSSSLEVITGGVGHYVFLSEPTPLGLREARYIFTDPQTVDRRAIHDHVCLAAIRLFGGSPQQPRKNRP
jgi:predicted dienelactone hydrolase